MNSSDAAITLTQLNENYSSLAAEDGVKAASLLSDRIENVIAMYISPVVVLLGLVGNILNILILCRKRNRPSSTRTLLCCLSVMDTFVLTVQVPYIIMAYFDWFDSALFTANAFYTCYVRYTLTNVGLSAVAWLSAAVSIDRLASVKNVHKLRRFLKRHARTVATAIVLTSCVLNSTRFVQFKPVDAPAYLRTPAWTWVQRRRTYCQQTELISGTVFGAITDYLSGILNTFVPTLCMIVFGAIICVNLVKLKRVRRALFAQQPAGLQSSTTALDVQADKLANCADSSDNQNPSSTSLTTVCRKTLGAPSSSVRVASHHSLAQQRLCSTDKRISLATKMVVATISLFVLSGLPSFCLTTASAIFGREIYQYDVTNCVRHVSNLLIFVNVSFCFLLYCCTCSKYRRAVRKLLRCNKRRNERSLDTTENAMEAGAAGFYLVRRTSDVGSGLLAVINQSLSHNNHDCR